MIYSMTGYASKVLQYNNTTVQMEIKSVNHRFLDITIKSAEEFKPIDNNIRALVSKYISRGKIDIRIFFKENREQEQHLTINQSLLSEYLKLVSQIKASSSDNITCSVNEIITFPGMLSQQICNLEDLQPPLLCSFEEMLTDLLYTQQKEGEKIESMLETRLKAIGDITTDIYPLLKNITQNYQAKLKQRLTDFLNEADINDSRLQQEFAFFCQKMDVSEEVDRLNAHVSEFFNLLKTGGNIGKRLDFICQEMHREANTFGSKSVAMETTSKAVDLKVLIEQIREQVQNIM